MMFSRFHTQYFVSYCAVYHSNPGVFRGGAFKSGWSSALYMTQCTTFSYVEIIFSVCVEVLRPSQANGVMSSAVSLLNHTFTQQA